MVARIVLILALTCGGSAVVGNAATGHQQLLQSAVEKWLGERDHWAFTQRAVEYERGETRERLERYDPSRPGNQRWELLAIDGRPPTPPEREAWSEKKFKRRHGRKIDTPLGDFFDFRAARVVSEAENFVRFDVPLRRDKAWLFPTEKVGVEVTINKETHALEHLNARVREPFKVLLGLARVNGGVLDLAFIPFETDETGPAAARPTGSARASVYKFGERVDFTWSDFKRVTPARGAVSVGEANRTPLEK